MTYSLWIYNQPWKALSLPIVLHKYDSISLGFDIDNLQDSIVTTHEVALYYFFKLEEIH